MVDLIKRLLACDDITSFVNQIRGTFEDFQDVVCHRDKKKLKYTLSFSKEVQIKSHDLCGSFLLIEIRKDIEADIHVICCYFKRYYTEYFTRLLGVHVRNADFGQQMVHQSSLCYKDLTLHHFVVSSTSIRRARVLNWKSVFTVLCCFVRYVEIYIGQRTFANWSNFLFLFEENYWRIIPITSRSLWWTCPIARYLWTMISAFQKWWLQGCRQRTWKTAKEIRKCEIASIVGRRWLANTKSTRWVIGRWSTSCFQGLREIGNI